MKAKEILVNLCCLSLIILFSYTAWDKVFDDEAFLYQLRRSPFPLMQLLAMPLVWLVPLVQVLVAVFLLLPHQRRRGLIASMVLLGVFEVYIVVMLLSGKELACVCTGVFDMSWPLHLVFNAGFMGVAGMGLCTLRHLEPKGEISRRCASLEMTEREHSVKSEC